MTDKLYKPEIEHLITMLDNANHICLVPEYDPYDFALRKKLEKMKESACP